MCAAKPQTEIGTETETEQGYYRSSGDIPVMQIAGSKLPDDGRQRQGIKPAARHPPDTHVGTASGALPAEMKKRKGAYKEYGGDQKF